MKKNITKKLALTAAGALASGVLLMSASAVATAAPGDCFGIPNCNIFGIEGTGNGGGGYANGTAGGGLNHFEIRNGVKVPTPKGGGAGGGGAYANGKGGGAWKNS